VKSICVFCGSSPGGRPEYAQAAEGLGRTLAERGLTLVYGGSSVGTMGRLARSALEAGGRVVGVIPRVLVEMEVAYAELPDLRVVETLHERKALMAELGDAFVALPGGLGTVEEFFEALAWAQLGVHAKPCGLLNVARYFDPLIAFLDHAVSECFLQPAHREMVAVAETPDALLERLAVYQPPQVSKAEWVLRLTRGEE